MASVVCVTALSTKVPVGPFYFVLVTLTLKGYSHKLSWHIIISWYKLLCLWLTKSYFVTKLLSYIIYYYLSNQLSNVTSYFSQKQLVCNQQYLCTFVNFYFTLLLIFSCMVICSLIQSFQQNSFNKLSLLAFTNSVTQTCHMTRKF